MYLALREVKERYCSKPGADIFFPVKGQIVIIFGLQRAGGGRLSHDLCCNHSSLVAQKQPWKYINEWAWLGDNKMSFVYTKFHVCFTCHEILFSF